MSDRLAAHLPPAIRNLPARTRRLTIGAAAAITIVAAVAIPALLTAAARPGNAVLAGHSGPVFSVAFSPDGKILAGGGNTSMRLWDMATRRPIGHPLTGPTGGVISVAFSPDGKILAGGGGAQGVRLWDVGTGHQIRNHLTGHTGPVGSVAISPDGKTLAGAGAHGVRLWDLTTGRQIGDLLTGRTNWVGSVAFSPDGKTLAGGGGYDGLRSRVWLWDMDTGRPIGHRLTRSDGGIGSVAFSPDGKTLASGGISGPVRLWDVATGRPIGHPLVGHTGPVSSVAFSPDGKTLASASVDGTVRLWDVATGGATTATGPPPSGLEKKSPAGVLQAAAAALRAAKSVHIVGSDPPGHFNYRIQGSSTIGTITLPRGQTRFRVIGRYGYVKTDLGHDAGRWLKYPSQAFEEFTIAQWASFSGNGPLEPKVQQATINGRKVVVVNWRNGSKLYVANTGPAYPLREEFNGNYPVQMAFSEYNVPLDIAAPRNAIDASKAG